MKFDRLFQQVFITEQDENIVPDENGNESPVTSDTPTDAPEGVPVPNNYDVEPAPVAQTANNGSQVREFITKLEEFADSLNGVDSESLQKIVSDIDRPGSLFQGISRETSSDIIKLAEQTVRLSEILKGFIINSAKRQRDIASGQ
jgi:hypothetical protein